MPFETFAVAVGEDSVTARLYASASAKPARAALVLGHGAGAPQAHPFMVRYASELAARGIDVVTFDFLYTERKKKLPDKNDALEACYLRVVEAVRARLPGRALFLGGKSMGGRIASQIAATMEPGALAGLVFLGYPLHPPGKPEQLRSKHLPRVAAPMLFVQGTRDAFGTPEELAPIARSLARGTEVFVVEGGDHSFTVPKKLGEPHARVLDHVAGWIAARGSVGARGSALREPRS